MERIGRVEGEGGSRRGRRTAVLSVLSTMSLEEEGGRGIHIISLDSAVGVDEKEEEDGDNDKGVETVEIELVTGLLSLDLRSLLVVVSSGSVRFTITSIP